MKRKLLSVAVIFCAVMLLCVPKVFGDTVDVEYVTYEVSDEEATVKKCSIAATAKVSIQGYINGVPVTSVSDSAFEDCVSLTEIELPKSITSIGNFAFRNCYNLRNVTLPENLEFLGSYAFYSCESLTKISVPSKITSLEDHTFKDCKRLYDITLPDGLLSVGEGAFGCCEALSHLSIPQDVTYIGEDAFLGCKNLKSISIPDGVSALLDHTFLGCSKLEEIELPKNLKSLGNGVFENCSELSEISLSEALEEIGKDVFGGECGISSVYYDGNETSWNKIKINFENSNLSEAEKVFNMAMSDKTYEITPPDWVDIGECIIYASYDGDVLLDAQTKIYKGKPLHYAADKRRTVVRFFIWDENMKPRDSVNILE